MNGAQLTQVLIVGAGGFGREMEMWLSRDPRHGVEFVVGGFLDDAVDALAPFAAGGRRVVGTVKDYRPAPGESLLMAIADPAVKQRVSIELLGRGARFFTYIHPSSTVGPTVRLGEGAVICPFSAITCDAVVGRFVTVNTSCTIGHDVRMGDYCTLSGHCDVTGGVRMGDRVFLGSRVSIVPGNRIGDDARVGAGSVVITPVKPGTTVFGMPAKKL
jgi:sugar O-acyltransferase (sialic acid O-acetyltransferase NeuD family)